MGKLSATHILLLSFLFVILIGSILLSLPLCTVSGEFTPFIDSLFTATTSTCVTGLVTVPTYSHWNLLGQFIILCLIQIGGLGVITAVTGVSLFIYNKLGISDSMLLQDTLNLNNIAGIKYFIKRMIIGTFIVELIGAIGYMFVFVPDYGIRGVWISLFTSVSAFCNAGLDLIGDTSLTPYALNPVINIVTSILIILGGLGYIVWWDILSSIKKARETSVRSVSFRNLTLHSKIVLSSTLFLILFGALLIFIFEYNNPLTFANYNFFEKVELSLFQSITTRTAGFFTVPQENFTNSSFLICLLLMFIGGSPVGTAGGVKTVTIVVLLLYSLSTIRNRNDVNIFNRKLSKDSVNKSVSVVFMSFTILFLSTLLLCCVSDGNFLDILYETVSATATVGLSRNFTSSLNLWGKLIIIITMYLGRVGPISLAVAFNMKHENTNKIKNPVEEIVVG